MDKTYMWDNAYRCREKSSHLLLNDVRPKKGES